MDLFSPYQLGNLQLNNRIIMAPMTRSRAIEDNVPNPLSTIYYSERASAGLIITEASPISPQAIGYIRTPAIYSAKQIDGWKNITKEVHKKGGKIFLQLWHVGRVSHPDFHNGEMPVAPSAIAADGEVFTFSGKKKMVAPRALELSEIPSIIQQYKKAAQNAIEAEFDGVELHGANGYLLDQFLKDGSNKRTDQYGGSIENRTRFLLEVTKAVIEVWGKDRVGYRISPTSNFNSMFDSNPLATFSYLAEELNKLDICYLHVAEKKPTKNELYITPYLRRIFTKSLIVNSGYNFENANKAIHNNEADLVSFGSLFIANPDLPQKFRQNAVLNKPDPATFYSGEEKGYIDYPSL